MINGEVRPPAIYFQAEEILRRQYTACLVDAMARDPLRKRPRSAGGAMGSSDRDSFLGDLIAAAEAGGQQAVERFTDSLAPLPQQVIDDLKAGYGRSPARARACSPLTCTRRAVAGR